jgi:hypothetical protein
MGLALHRSGAASVVPEGPTPQRGAEARRPDHPPQGSMVADRASTARHLAVASEVTPTPRPHRHPKVPQWTRSPQTRRAERRSAATHPEGCVVRAASFRRTSDGGPGPSVRQPVSP